MNMNKKMHYVMQGGEKPARNYLGKQKTVSNIPVKWKSGPNAPATELAYITEAEKNLLLKADLHGSLKNGPNTGPDNIISLDSQGDYTRDRSPAGRQSSPGGPDRSRISQDKHDAHMRSILTGQRNIGQTAAVSDRVRRGAVPEYVNTPAGMKYVGSAIKGRRGFLDRIFNRSNVQGLRSIQLRGTPGQPGFGYYSDDEEVGDIKPGWGGRIFGGLASLLTGIPIVGGAVGSAIDYGKGIFGKQPRDMTQFNRLGLYGQVPEDFEQVERYGTDKTPMESLTMANWGNNLPEEEQTFNNQNFNPNFLAPGSAEGGRVGLYAGGDPEEPAENVFEFMQDQGVPHSEMVSNEWNDQLLENLFEKYLELGFSPTDAEKMALEEFEQMGAAPSEDQGIASLV